MGWDRSFVQQRIPYAVITYFQCRRYEIEAIIHFSIWKLMTDFHWLLVKQSCMTVWHHNHFTMVKWYLIYEPMLTSALIKTWRCVIWTKFSVILNEIKSAFIKNVINFHMVIHPSNSFNLFSIQFYFILFFMRDTFNSWVPVSCIFLDAWKRKIYLREAAMSCRKHLLRREQETGNIVSDNTIRIFGTSTVLGFLYIK